MESTRNTDRAAAALGIAGRAAAATCGVLSVTFAAYVLWRSAVLLALLYAAAMIAVVLDRPVAALARRGLRRAWALALVVVGAGAVTLGIAGVTLGPLVAQVVALATAAPELADRLRAALVARFDGALDRAPGAAALHDALTSGAGALARGTYEAAGGIANAAGAIVTVLVLAMLLLASGSRLVRQAIEAVPAHRRPWAEALARDLSSSLGGYLAGLGVMIVARVVASGIFLLVARIPFVIPLALLAGASVLVPYLGAVLRVLSIGAVAWATRGPGTAAAALAFVLAYDALENYVLSPIVYRKTVGVSALGQLVAVLFLGYHLGVAGAVLAIPVAAAAQITLRALRTPAGALPAGPRAGAGERPGSAAEALTPRGGRSR
jgi:putative heme transporter